MTVYVVISEHVFEGVFSTLAKAEGRVRWLQKHVGITATIQKEDLDTARTIES